MLGRKNADGWFDRFKGDVSGVEKMMNQLTVWDLFDGGDFRDHVDDLDQLAAPIVRSWSCLLRATYPEARFQVDLYDDRDDLGPQVTFYSILADE